jgi:hypothetical protein
MSLILTAAVLFFIKARWVPIFGEGVPAIVDLSTPWNVRRAPSPKSAVIGGVYEGEAVVVACLDEGWAKLIRPSAGGFVDSDGLILIWRPSAC